MPTLPEAAAKTVNKPRSFNPRVLISRLDQPRMQLQQVARHKTTQFKNHLTTTFRTPVLGLEMSFR